MYWICKLRAGEESRKSVCESSQTNSIRKAEVLRRLFWSLIMFVEIGWGSVLGLEWKSLNTCLWFLLDSLFHLRKSDQGTNLLQFPFVHSDRIWLTFLCAVLVFTFPCFLSHTPSVWSPAPSAGPSSHKLSSIHLCRCLSHLAAFILRALLFLNIVSLGFFTHVFQYCTAVFKLIGRSLLYSRFFLQF